MDRTDHPWGYRRSVKVTIPSANEIQALRRVPCGHRTRNHGFVIICTLPVIHPGPHEGSSGRTIEAP
jgi:hypothetical protein